MHLVIWAAGLPGIGYVVRWVAGLMFGITNAPNVVMSGFEVNSDDPRPSHRGWHYVVVENQQRDGRNSRYPTKDAEQTVISLYFARGADPVRESEGVFLKSAVESPEAMTTLIVGRPRHIPVYLVASETCVVEGTGITVHCGVYITNGDWFHQALAEHQRLDPGSYEVTIELQGKWGVASFVNSLTVPDLESTPEAALGCRLEG